MKIIWSPTARASYKEIIDKIIELWNFDIVIRFSKSVDTLVENLEDNKKSCLKSTLVNADNTLKWFLVAMKKAHFNI